MKARYRRHTLQFKAPSGTSRGILEQKETWFIFIESNGKIGVGECGLLRGLSVDDRPDYEEKLQWTCDNIVLGLACLYDALQEFPSIQFGLETAFQSLKSEDPFILFPSDFTTGSDAIEINGLVWMSSAENMKRQIEEKISEGFRCVKLKIGAINFEEELDLLRFIRKNFTSEQIEIRVDANGAFSYTDALHKLNQIAEFEIHSIEQPIAVNQHDHLKILCIESPIPIALDEELIGVFSNDAKRKLLDYVRPQFIILKPSLIGGFRGCADWISAAESVGAGWWITSALESNLGLNAIAQWTYLQKNPMPQGLGTGGLYTNNIDSPLFVENGSIKYDVSREWISFD